MKYEDIKKDKFLYDKLCKTIISQCAQGITQSKYVEIMENLSPTFENFIQNTINNRDIKESILIVQSLRNLFEEIFEEVIKEFISEFITEFHVIPDFPSSDKNTLN